MRKKLYILLLLMMYCIYAYSQEKNDLLTVINQYCSKESSYKEDFEKLLTDQFYKLYKHCSEDSIESMLENTRMFYVPQFYLSSKDISKSGNNILNILKFDIKRPYALVCLLKDSCKLIGSYEIQGKKYRFDFAKAINVPGLKTDYYYDQSPHCDKFKEHLSLGFVFCINSNFENYLIDNDFQTTWWIWVKNRLIAYRTTTFEFVDGNKLLHTIYSKMRI